MTIKNALIAAIACLLINSAWAQKLPAIQTTSLRAPADLKIDGNAKEWNNLIQAYNKNTNLYYTLANDDKNLYLTVQVSDPRTIEKLLIVGLSLTIDKGQNERSIKYPIIKWGFVLPILVNAGTKAKWSGNPTQGSMFAQTLTRTDSTVAVANQLFSDRAKSIDITGLKEVPDPSISIYNEQNIKTAALFDKNGVFTYELAVPLQLLNKSVNEAKPFKYEIKLNSCADYTESTFMRKDPVTGKREEVDANTDIDVVTKLDGEYTLAKKP